jgi:hypothetical protein
MSIIRFLFILLSFAAAILPGILKISDIHPELDKVFGEQRRFVQSNFENHYIPFVSQLTTLKLPETHLIIQSIGVWEISLGVLSLFSGFFTFLLMATFSVIIWLHTQTDGIEAAFPAIVVLSIHFIRFSLGICAGGSPKKRNSNNENKKKKD